MSLDELPTELDVIIVGYLDPLSVWALARASKKFYNVAEPFLCRDLLFSVNDDICIIYCLIAMLTRPELAQRVRSVYFDGVSKPTNYPYIDRPKLTGVFFRALQRHSKQISSYLRDIRAGMPYWVKDFINEKQWPRSGSCLGLIVFLAANIESIELHSYDSLGAISRTLEHLSMKFAVAEDKRNEKNDSQASDASKTAIIRKPWSRLRSITTENILVLSVPFPPTLELLELQNATMCRPELYVWHIKAAHNYSHTYSIHTIKIDNVNLELRPLVGFISTGWMQNLKTLSVRRSGISPPDPDSPSLMQAIRDHLPNLESFSWVRVYEYNFSTTMGSWRGAKFCVPDPTAMVHLTNLKSLHIDSYSLVKQLDNNLMNFLITPVQILPPNIEELHIYDPLSDALYNALDEITWEETLAKMRPLFDLYLLRKLSLTLDAIDYACMCPHIELALQYASNELYRSGKILKLYWRECEQNHSRDLGYLSDCICCPAEEVGEDLVEPKTKENVEAPAEAVVDSGDR